MASPHRHRQESVTETEAQSQDCVASLFGAWGVETQCRASPGLSGEESACNARGTGNVDSIPGSGRSFWRRAWQPTPVFLPGECQGQRILVDYSPQRHKELDTTEVT